MRIAVYGASGFTGKLVLAELTSRNVDVVAVGRNADLLRQAPTYRVAAIDDHDALVSAFRGCDVVINCVAPFVLHGEPVVRAAIAAGVHYVDVSGEQTYIKRVFDTFTSEAEAAGVTVVPMANDGGLLADLLVSMLAGSDGQDVQDVVVAHRTTGSAGLSRGSGRTALANSDLFTGGGLSFSDGEWRAGVPGRHTSITFPSEPAPSPVLKFAMPEVATIPRHVPARHVEGVADAALAGIFAAITPELVERLPTDPVQGGQFVLVAEVDGKRGVVEGSDTYGTTAVIAVEAAVRLAGGSSKPGVLAPAQAFDARDFIHALTGNGVRLSI
jgi:short subunit dehydrogenase-like uncharacterized protein